MEDEEDMELPSPARRILLEMNPLYYPFGNTPALNVLEGHQVDHPYKVYTYLDCQKVGTLRVPPL
jgi:hypothetical protein